VRTGRGRNAAALSRQKQATPRVRIPGVYDFRKDCLAAHGVSGQIIGVSGQALSRALQ
jgi:hypothetical protein